MTEKQQLMPRHHKQSREAQTTYPGADVTIAETMSSKHDSFGTKAAVVQSLQYGHLLCVSHFLDSTLLMLVSVLALAELESL